MLHPWPPSADRTGPCAHSAHTRAPEHAERPLLPRGALDAPSCRSTGRDDDVPDMPLLTKHTSPFRARRAKAQGNVQSAGGDHARPTAKAARCPGAAHGRIGDSLPSQESTFGRRVLFTDACWSLRGPCECGPARHRRELPLPLHCGQRPSTCRLVWG